MVRALLVCLALTALAPTLDAGPLAPPPPLTRRIVQADAVLVGKVVSFEERTIKGEGQSGDRVKRDYRIAVVKIEETLLGAKGLTHVKVGLPPPVTFPGSGGVLRTMPAAKLIEGQTVLLVLASHPKETFYIMRNANDALDSQTSTRYRAEVELARRCAKLLADPTAGLRAKDAGDRLLTAGLVLTRYQTPRPGYGMASISAKESKAILRVLLEADWTRTDPTSETAQPLGLFYSLGLTERDGWKQPADFREVPEAARKWLKENVETYRVKGYQFVK
jgi:hypothetical protein